MAVGKSEIARYVAATYGTPLKEILDIGGVVVGEHAKAEDALRIGRRGGSHVERHLLIALDLSLDRADDQGLWRGSAAQRAAQREQGGCRQEGGKPVHST